MKLQKIEIKNRLQSQNAYSMCVLLAPSGVSPRVEDQGSEVEEEGSVEEEISEEEIEEEVIEDETMAVPLEETATGEDHTDQTEGVSAAGNFYPWCTTSQTQYISLMMICQSVLFSLNHTRCH